MTDYKITKILEHPELIEKASVWFHSKWNVPVSAYVESMNDCVKNKSGVPQWYIIINEAKIIAGIGVIDNDFHDRPDLSPNVCAVYVEKEYRNKGIAGKMLSFVCKEMKNKGIDTLYLITDHTSFYERYGWNFYTMVQGDGQPNKTRLYIHKS